MGLLGLVVSHIYIYKKKNPLPIQIVCVFRETDNSFRVVIYK